MSPLDRRTVTLAWLPSASDKVVPGLTELRVVQTAAPVGQTICDFAFDPSQDLIALLLEPEPIGYVLALPSCITGGVFQISLRL